MSRPQHPKPPSGLRELLCLRAPYVVNYGFKVTIYFCLHLLGRRIGAKYESSGKTHCHIEEERFATSPIFVSTRLDMSFCVNERSRPVAVCGEGEWREGGDLSSRAQLITPQAVVTWKEAKVQNVSQCKFEESINSVISSYQRHVMKSKASNIINYSQKASTNEALRARRANSTSDLFFFIHRVQEHLLRMLIVLRAGNKGEFNILLPNFSPYRSLLKVTSKETVLSHKSVHALSSCEASVFLFIVFLFIVQTVMASVVEGYPRKRARNKDNWKRFASKKNRNEGKDYVSQTTKRVIAPGEVGEPCGCGCFDKGKSPTYNAQTFNLGNEEINQLYDSPVVVAPEKLKDIRDLLSYVPLPWSRYFEGILETQHLPTTLQTPADVDEENDDDQKTFVVRRGNHALSLTKLLARIMTLSRAGPLAFVVRRGNHALSLTKLLARTTTLSRAGPLAFVVRRGNHALSLTKLLARTTTLSRAGPLAFVVRRGNHALSLTKLLARTTTLSRAGPLAFVVRRGNHALSLTKLLARTTTLSRAGPLAFVVRRGNHALSLTKLLARTTTLSRAGPLAFVVRRGNHALSLTKLLARTTTLSRAGPLAFVVRRGNHALSLTKLLARTTTLSRAGPLAFVVRRGNHALSLTKLLARTTTLSRAGPLAFVVRRGNHALSLTKLLARTTTLSRAGPLAFVVRRGNHALSLTKLLARTTTLSRAGPLAFVVRRGNHALSLTKLLARTTTLSRAGPLAFVVRRYGKFNIILMLASLPGVMANIFDTSAMSYVLPSAVCDLKLDSIDKGVLNAITYAEIARRHSSFHQEFGEDLRMEALTAMMTVVFHPNIDVRRTGLVKYGDPAKPIPVSTFKHPLGHPCYARRILKSLLYNNSFSLVTSSFCRNPDDWRQFGDSNRQVQTGIYRDLETSRLLLPRGGETDARHIMAVSTWWRWSRSSFFDD
uniref:Uncharacterized protein n=1 Tax=Timema genevievae TaxID=629358 RepID=A0A7R9K8Z0_TIMGE|nr:unnamed protein product [Timema genevievae]